MASPSHQDSSAAIRGNEDSIHESMRIEHADTTGAEIDVQCDTSSVKSQNGVDGEIDTSYLRASRFTKFWRSVLFQMLLFGADKVELCAGECGDAVGGVGVLC
ncbi:hypothetical protein O988_05879 [Pseudogymnoascus sp. VKM F-3808]|nr:hypothetical protein O988_05879 [Pseudogymnoascus sp. VKM F-3808]